MILMPLVVRKLLYSLVGKLGLRLIGPLLAKYRIVLIGLAGVALVAGGAYVWHQLNSLGQYKASVAVLTEAVNSERAVVLALEAERTKERALLEQRTRRIAQLETHARELVARLREIPTDACLDSTAPPAVIDLLRQ